MSENKKQFDYSKLNFFNPENMLDGSISEIMNRENNSFPDRLLEKSELAHMVQVVGRKIGKYKDNKCFPYIIEFYRHLDGVFNSTNQEKMLNNYAESLKNIQYFSLCWNENRNKKNTL